MDQDLYQVLGVKPGSTDTEIQKAFRTLAKKFHPDVNPGNKQAEQRFKEVSLAYEVLKDSAKRQKYDQMRLGGFRGRGGNSRSAPFDPDVFSDLGLGDLFSQIFGAEFGQGGVRFASGQDPFQTMGTNARSGRSRMNARPQMEEAELPLSFLEAVVGGDKLIELSDGRRLTVKIPPGIESGTKIRLTGQASQGRGDLILVACVSNHPYFEREGLNIILKTPISFSEAVLGAEIEVPTLTGTVVLKIPKGVSSGTRLKLSGKGIQQSGRTGDELVELSIKVPKELSAEYTEAANLLKNSRFNPRADSFR